ncbi:hypothetical protein NECAME_12043 [Necator americanus]|uniref:Uncharacterized protein n=1 Tax=Necator americanus TaxID=51031 RepID=W2T218_NECAM|nr:hypothetical protein NECAME_12043 [Necator americanus]ETN75943.1 hypothetical protein NECAME_12043 [Necator americanus]
MTAYLPCANSSREKMLTTASCHAYLISGCSGIGTSESRERIFWMNPPQHPEITTHLDFFNHECNPFICGGQRRDPAPYK